MDNTRVARKLVKLAKTLTADFGDAQAYFNIFNEIEREDGEDFDKRQMGVAKAALDEAIGDSYRQLNAVVKKALRRKEGDLARFGLRVKRGI